MKLTRRPLCIAVSAATVALWTSFTRAADGAVLEEVVVTASRRAENLQDTPFNVSALSGEELRGQGILRPEDLVKGVAGISVIDGGARNRNAISIRGIGSPGASSSDFFSTEATSYYLDETPLENMNLRIKDVQRVEVLRGPQGTLYGGGAMGGTVRYLMNAPDAGSFSGEATASMSSTDGAGGMGQDHEVVLNVPLLKDRVALRLLGNWFEDAGFVDTRTYPDEAADGSLEERQNRDSNKERTRLGRAVLGAQLTEDVSLTASWTRQEQQADGRQAYTLDSPTSNPEEVGREYNHDYIGRDAYATFNPEDAKRDIELYSLKLEADFDAMRLTVNASHYKDDYQTRGDITRFLEGLFDGYYAPFDELNGWDDNRIGSETDTLEARLQSAGENSVDWVAGVFWTQQDRSWDLLENTPGLNEYIWGEGTDVVPNDFVMVSSGDYEQLAAYGELTWHVMDRLDLSAGMRWFDMKDDTSMTIWYPIYDGLDGFDDPADASFDETQNGDLSDEVYKLNASYKFTDQVMAYATWSQGFRRGGANVISAVQAPPGTEALLADSRFYEPDTLDNWELGLKSEWFDGRMTLNSAVYYIQWKDIQRYVGSVEDAQGNTIGLPIDQRVNSGDAVSKGVEVELRALLAEGLVFSGGLSWNEIEADGDTPYQKDGERIPGKPRWQGGASLAYTRSIGEGVDLEANLATSFRDEIPTDSTLYSKLDGYVMLDASLGLVTDSWRAGLFVSNLGDEFVETSYSGSQYKPRVYRNRPRTFGLSVGYRF